MNVDKIKVIIDKYADDFLETVKDNCSKPILINFNDTPIEFFHPSSEEYFLSEHYEIKLEHLIQDKLMHELLITMLREAKLSVEEGTRCSHNPHERYTEDASLSFIITTPKGRIG